MFESLSEKIYGAVQRLRGQDRITASNVAPAIKEVKRALLAADVPYGIAKLFINRVKEGVLGQRIRVGAAPGQVFTKVVCEELTLLMGSSARELVLSGNPAVVLLVGLQGAGKTTLAVKLAAKLKRTGKEVVLVAADVYRPAAADQLQVLGDAAGVEVYRMEGARDPILVAERSLLEAKRSGKQVVIVDTAGQQGVDRGAMEEVAAVKRVLQPSETLFVVDAMVGKSVIEVARAFEGGVGLDGVVLTKMDSDTRGGVAIAIAESIGRPIKLLSTGEKVADLEVFHPDRMARRILGMADVVSFVERAEEHFDQQEAKRVAKKFYEKRLDFDDLYNQLVQLKRMGNYRALLGGDQANGGEEFLECLPAAIQSMTPGERREPLLLKEPRRVARVAAGSGHSEEKVRRLLKRFFSIRQLDSKKLQKHFSSLKPNDDLLRRRP